MYKALTLLILACSCVYGQVGQAPGISNPSGSGGPATAWSGITAATNSNAGTFAMSGNALDLTAATLVKLRVAGGLTTSVNGDCGYDSTGKIWHCWQNGHDYLMIAASNIGATGQAFLSNSDGSGTFADPIVSGATAIAAAPSTNPVFVCGWDGTNIRCPLVENSTPGASDYALAVRNIPSGTQSINQAQIGGTAVLADPCQQLAKTYTPISLTANTKLLTGVSAKKYYVCEIHLIAAAATNVAIVEGTGSTCGTGTAGIFGGSTAATGWNLAANGGLVLGVGGFSIGNTATNADDLCLFVSAANQISGNIVTVNF